MCVLSWIAVLLMSSACVWSPVLSGNPDAKRLYDDLLSNYNKLVRPVNSTSDILEVRIRLRLSQLIDVVSPKLLKHLTHEPFLIMRSLYGFYCMHFASVYREFFERI